MASPLSLGNQHCANCIGTLKFPNTTSVKSDRGIWPIDIARIVQSSVHVT